ncbi:transposase, partial [Escherichia coli]|nr:transposase [Escherichia coli]
LLKITVTDAVFAVPAYGPQNDVTLKMPAFEWVHVQLHQQKGMISLSPTTICNSARKNKTVINIEYMKASIRARVEHPFRIIKRQFGFVKARYKGLLKNDNQLAMLFTLANLFRVDQMIRQWERSQ